MKTRDSSRGSRRRPRDEAGVEAREKDARWVALAQQGDRAAFGHLYERHVERVYRYIRFRVLDEDLAEDLTHDVFLGAWRALPGFEWRGDLRPWLLRAAHNRVANHWRTLGRRPQGDSLEGAVDEAEGSPQGALAAALTADEESALEQVSRALQLSGVEALLGRLSDAQRQVVALRFGQELSVAETAEIMGRSASAVKNLQYEALSRMRTLLQGASATREPAPGRPTRSEARARAEARPGGTARAPLAGSSREGGWGE